MAKSAIILVSALLFLFLGLAHCHDRFFVEGKVYCDTCRAHFVTRISEYIPGSTVRLECRDREGGRLTYSRQAVTDASGTYRLPVEGDHEEEVCEILVVKSGRADCAEISNEAYHRQSARISLTSNNGIVTPVRQANPLGFLKKKALTQCPEVLRELGFTSTGGLV